MAQTIYLVDTNVVSEFIKKRPNANVMSWLQTVERIAISAVTIEEANYGLAWRPDARKLSLFRASVERMHMVYPITESIAQRAGVLRGQFQAQGITRTTPDMLIAATAQEHQLIIATRNVNDFSGCGVQVLNPFDDR
jgi:toxin FitB